MIFLRILISRDFRGYWIRKITQSREDKIKPQKELPLRLNFIFAALRDSFLSVPTGMMHLRATSYHSYNTLMPFFMCSFKSYRKSKRCIPT